jgi:hypothetical protein
MLELIEKLSPEQQQVLTLKFVFNFPNAEVATILGKTEGAIKSLQHRALVSLQKQIRSPRASGARGRHRRAAELGQDDAVPRADGARAGTETSGWRDPDPRLQQLARSSRREGHAGRDPRRRRPGTGPALLGNLRQVDALLVVLDGFSGTRDPDDDLETLKLELLVADRDHVERRLERVAKQAKSGDAKLRRRSRGARAAARAPRRRRHARRLAGRAAARARAADDEAADRVENGPGGIDLKLEAELAELPEEEARSSARARRRSARSRGGCEALDLITFFTAGEKETRAWTLRAADRARRGGDDPLRHRARLHPLRGDPLGRPRRRPARTRRSRGAGKQRLEGKTYVVEDGDVLNIRFNV